MKNAEYKNFKNAVVRANKTDDIFYAMYDRQVQDLYPIMASKFGETVDDSGRTGVDFNGLRMLKDE